VSSTGQYQTAVMTGGGFIWISADFGINWSYSGANENWQSVAIDPTGQYQTAVVNGGNIWRSTNYGILGSWSQITGGFLPPPPNQTWTSISISVNALWQTAARSGGTLVRTGNTGSTWFPVATSQNWQSVSLSSTGQYQTAVSSTLFFIPGGIWISQDFGANWTQVATPQNWKSVSLSSTGQYQTAVVGGGNIWISQDFGANWSEKIGTGYPTANQGWYAVSISGNAVYQTAVILNGNIWTSSNYGNTSNNVFVSGRMAIGKNTITPTYTLDVSGNVNATSYTSTSDYRIKDNVRPITSTIDELRPLAYFNRLSGKEDMGLIAHELQEHFPFLVNGEKDGTDYQSINYLGLVGLLVKEFQDLKTDTTDLEDRMTNLENQK